MVARLEKVGRGLWKGIVVCHFSLPLLPYFPNFAGVGGGLRERLCGDPPVTLSLYRIVNVLNHRSR